MFDSPFRWIPGLGPDPLALDRMMREFPRPGRPMGEAWFMSDERQMYPELLGGLATLSDDEIATALTEIATGTSSFGALSEWTEWFHYLLPRLIERRWMPTILPRPELLVTAFMAQHPRSTGELPYARFRADALATLGRLIMMPGYWPGGAVDIRDALGKWTGPNGVAGWYRVGGLLSASLVFCLKYLPREEIEGWFGSVLAIPDPHWRVQIVTWMVGAHPLLSGEIDQPSRFPEQGAFRVGWDWSHILDGHFSGDDTEPVELIRFLPDGHGEIVLRLARGFAVDAVFDRLKSDLRSPPSRSRPRGSAIVSPRSTAADPHRVALYRNCASVSWNPTSASKLALSTASRTSGWVSGSRAASSSPALRRRVRRSRVALGRVAAARLTKAVPCPLAVATACPASKWSATRLIRLDTTCDPPRTTVMK